MVVSCLGYFAALPLSSFSAPVDVITDTSVRDTNSLYLRACTVVTAVFPRPYSVCDDFIVIYTYEVLRVYNVIRVMTLWLHLLGPASVGATSGLMMYLP